METLRKQLEQIQKNLASLNATQKMLVGTLVALIVITLFWYAHYASATEMVAVLPQQVSEAEMSRMTAALDQSGIEYKVETGKLLVPTEQRQKALSTLGFMQALPHDTSTGFDQMSTKWGLWDTPSRSDAMDNHAKEITLSQVISNFPNVSSAVVMLTPTSYHRIGDNSVGTASVTIDRKDKGPNAKQLVEAAASLVRGAIPGLKLSDVNVVIDGRARPMKDDSAGIGGWDNQLETISAYRDYVANTIRNEFPYIDGIVASADGKLNTETANTQTQTYDKDHTISIPSESTSQSNETQSSAAASAEAGVTPNVGASIGGAGGGGSNTTSDSTETVKNAVLPSFVTEQKSKPAGDFVVTSASVRIPETYFSGSLRNKLSRDPTAAELQDFITGQLADIRKEVQKVIGIKSAEDIFVGTYLTASATSSATTAAASIGATSNVSAMVGAWGKQAAVGVLALVSLFMVSSMVKRSTPAPVVPIAPAASEARGPITLGGNEAVAGLVTGGGPQLSGMELDDETVQTQQILEQVSSLVGDNPEAAANLVKRWMNRT